MKIQQTICRASVWPHRPTDEYAGPLNFQVSVKNQPPVVQAWTKGQCAYVQIEQPDPLTNLTMVRLLLGGHPFKGKWYNVRPCRIKRDQSLKFYIKKRVVESVEHPIPVGKWEGVCDFTDEWCKFTLQAMTMKVQKTQSSILGPDGDPITRIVTP